MESPVPSPRRKFALFLFVVVCALALTGVGCRRPAEKTGPEELVVWGLWQETVHLDPILNAYREQFGTKITYKKIASPGAYERDLLTALAEGRGPDVFVIHHTWTDEKRGILAPAPAEVVDERAVREEFVDVVADDLVREGRVLALPTSVDTLAMYFNKDILNTVGIARAPRTWTDYQQMVERVTRINRLGAIQQSAGAIGTAGNVNRASDIMQLLLLQSGLPIVQDGQVDLANEIGERAFTFYTDFANRGKQVYTWDLNQDYSIDAFAEGNTATMFNYSYHIPTIQAKNPRLNFDIAPMPQIAGSSDNSRVNFAAYWPFAVSSSSPNQLAAWNFVRFLTGSEQSQVLNEAQQTPPALRANVIESQRDPVLGVFAEQALTARTWPRYDITAIDALFNQAVDDVVTGVITAPEAARRIQDQLANLIKENRASPTP